MEKNERKKHPVLKTILIVLAVAIAAGVTAGYFRLKKSYNRYMSENTAGQSSIVGSEAPDFTLTTTDGEEFTLSEVLSEKDAAVLNIFATWCDPCEREFPYFEAIYQEYGDSIAMLSVSDDRLDSEEDIAAYKSGHGLSFPMAYSRDALSFIPRIGVPTTVIVDREGKIMFCQSGTFASKEAFESVITEFIGDGYSGRPVYLYTTGVFTKDGYLPDVTLKATAEDGSESELTTGEDGRAYIRTNEPHTYTIEVTGMPDGLEIPSATATAGPQSGYGLIRIK